MNCNGFSTPYCPNHDECRDPKCACDGHEEERAAAADGFVRLTISVELGRDEVAALRAERDHVGKADPDMAAAAFEARLRDVIDAFLQRRVREAREEGAI